MKKSMLVFAAALAATLSAAEAQARCASNFNIRLIPGVETEGVIHAKGGSPCSINVRRSSGASATRVVRQPQHGSVAVNGTRLVYRSEKGFVGQDRFIYQRDVMDKGGVERPATVRVTVVVQ